MTTRERGKLVATLLARSWHVSPPVLELSTESLASVAPLLARSGSAALAWRRISHSALRDCPAAESLLQGYRLTVVDGALRERVIPEVFAMLREAGVEPILAKGWAVARLYPEDGLRPYGDLDLTVRAEDFETATETVRGLQKFEYAVDLHKGFPWLDDRDQDEIHARSVVVGLDGADVRVLGSEDHLRLLCLHMLGHGVARPPWLCDLGVMLSTLPDEFDWEYLLGGDPRRSEAVVCALALARDLLGAPLDTAPPAVRERRLPRWLAPSVLATWGALGSAPQGQHIPFSDTIRYEPTAVLAALRERWPNAIEATVARRAPFNDWPRLPFQIGECVARVGRFLFYGAADLH